MKKGASTDPDLDTQIMSSWSQRNCATSIILHRLILEQGGQILEKETEEESSDELLNRAACDRRKKEERRFKKRFHLESEAEEESSDTEFEMLSRAANNRRNKHEVTVRRIISNRELEDSSDEDVVMPKRAAKHSRNIKKKVVDESPIGLQERSLPKVEYSIQQVLLKVKVKMKMSAIDHLQIKGMMPGLSWIRRFRID